MRCIKGSASSMEVVPELDELLTYRSAERRAFISINDDTFTQYQNVSEARHGT